MLRTGIPRCADIAVRRILPALVEKALTTTYERTLELVELEEADQLADRIAIIDHSKVHRGPSRAR